MRLLLAALIWVLAATVAQSAETTGIIDRIDEESGTLVLQDGTTYQLPGEFNVSDLTPGTRVVVVYDELDGETLVYDVLIE